MSLVQRPMYSARNDEVHLRLRVKLTVLDTGSNKQSNSSVGYESGGKKRLRTSTANGDINNNTAISTTTADVEMTSSSQENKDTLASASASVQAPGIGGEVNNPAGTTHYHHDPKTVVSRQYQLCQYGHPEPGRNLVVRSAILVKIHGDAFGFMTLLGYG